MSSSGDCEYVRGFGKLLAYMESTVKNDLLLVASLSDVHRLARRKILPKEGVTRSGVHYVVHGAGCRFSHADGREVDVDFLSDGRPIFDSWRVLNYIISVDPDYFGGRESVYRACKAMVGMGEIFEPRSAWFSLVSGSPPEE
ncbi:DUF6896 domain-containing protein [Spinactinospora alkalitolerans]|uniref:DUF6896 domain-containing protein n=1 Tax=Spinactinospora alkalitolerans TaxID=687207 RepID=UPI00337CAF99